MNGHSLDYYFKIFYDFFETFCHHLEIATQQTYFVHLCVALVVTSIIFYIVRRYRKNRQPIKLFNNSVGHVEVSRKALDELAQSVCYSMGAVNRPTVKIYKKFGRLSMVVALKIESTQRLADATANIQEALTVAFREHLGIEKLGKIVVNVTGFKGLIFKPNYKMITENNVQNLKKEDTIVINEPTPTEKKKEQTSDDGGFIL